MKYFRNTEVAQLHHVSEKAVRNWIQAARDNKLDLQLHDEDGRFYVANTSKNMALIEQLVEKGKKYKNTRAFKTISPKPEFYKIYTPRQILDIVSNLTIHHEMPLQYSYLDGGAVYWDHYAQRLFDEHETNILTSTVELLDLTAETIDKHTDYKKINVVDLGPGNGLPVRSTLERLSQQGRLNRYIAIDISPEMLQIVEDNVKQWFGDSVKYEGHVRDFTYERFDDLFIDDYSEEVANVVCLFGGTLSNFRAPTQVLQVINQSLGIDDVFLYTAYLDTPKTRRYFDFKVASGQEQKLSFTKVIYDLLNMDQSLYEVEGLFNEEKRERCIRIRPKVDLCIKLELPNGTRCVELRKNEPILDWRHLHYSALDIINLWDRNGFDMIQAAKSKNQQFLLLNSKIKTNTEVL